MIIAIASATVGRRPRLWSVMRTTTEQGVWQPMTMQEYGSSYCHVNVVGEKALPVKYYALHSESGLDYLILKVAQSIVQNQLAK